jgi:hypothetical protein
MKVFYLLLRIFIIYMTRQSDSEHGNYTFTAAGWHSLSLLDFPPSSPAASSTFSSPLKPTSLNSHTTAQPLLMRSLSAFGMQFTEFQFELEYSQKTPIPQSGPPFFRRHEYKDSMPDSSNNNTPPVSPTAALEARTQHLWTLRMAMTLAKLADNVFAQEVERIHKDSICLHNNARDGATESFSANTKNVGGVGGLRGWVFGYLDPDPDPESDDGDGLDDEGYDDEYHDAEDGEGTFEDAYSHSAGLERSVPDLPLRRPMSVAAVRVTHTAILQNGEEFPREHP